MEFKEIIQSTPKGQNSETDKPKIRSNNDNYMCNIKIIDFLPKNEFLTFFNFFISSVDSGPLLCLSSSTNYIKLTIVWRITKDIEKVTFEYNTSGILIVFEGVQLSEVERFVLPLAWLKTLL